MPLKPGAPPSKTIPELHTGKTYAHTLHKFGKQRADAQAIAIALHNQRTRAEGGRVQHPVDLVENPPGVLFRCPDCKYYRAGKCQHSDPRINGEPVTNRNCCNFFDHPGMKSIVK